MVDFGKKNRGTDICSLAQADARKVPIEIWVKETKPIVDELNVLQNEGKLNYAAFGAAALGALGYARSTKHVDIVVKARHLPFSDIAGAIAKEFGFTKCLRGENRIQMLVKEIGGYHYVLELWNDYVYVMDCDDEIWKKVVVGQSLGFPARTLSIEDMVSSKLGRFFTEHRREDITDMAFLLKNNGVSDFDYFVNRIQKIRRGNQTIDNFLFEEMSSLSEILGHEETAKLHSEIVNRRLYAQLLERMAFQFAKKAASVEEMARLSILTKKDAASILKKLGIRREKAGFTLPKNPNAIITRLVKNALVPGLA